MLEYLLWLDINLNHLVALEFVTTLFLC